MVMPPSTARYEAEAVAQHASAERYDRFVRLAQAIFGAPIAALNLIGSDRQFTVASVGFPRGEMPVEDSVCRVTVQQDEVLEVRDLREDERFSAIPARRSRCSDAARVARMPRGARFRQGLLPRFHSGRSARMAISSSSVRTVARAGAAPCRRAECGVELIRPNTACARTRDAAASSLRSRPIVSTHSST